jgi:hypothetical protein
MGMATVHTLQLRGAQRPHLAGFTLLYRAGWGRVTTMGLLQSGIFKYHLIKLLCKLLSLNISKQTKYGKT